MKLTSAAVQRLQDELLAYYDVNGRHELPWRLPESDGSFDPYKILLSELMLQQTQVPRVIPKYHEFLARFPDIQTLAASSLGDVLIVWQGLGYNRRAKFLWQAAQQIMTAYDGKFPQTSEALLTLPGVGRNTAGAIMAYAFNAPAIFVETNIRTVYFHHFFKDQTNISDKDIFLLIAATMPQTKGKRAALVRASEFGLIPKGAMRKNVVLSHRVFYWSLMDYGSHLKQQGLGRNHLSKHYAKQSRFEGSARQVRGRILRLLAAKAYLKVELLDELADDRAAQILEDLIREELIVNQHGQYCLAK